MEINNALLWHTLGRSILFDIFSWLSFPLHQTADIGKRFREKYSINHLCKYGCRGMYWVGLYESLMFFFRKFVIETTSNCAKMNWANKFCVVHWVLQNEYGTNCRKNDQVQHFFVFQKMKLGQGSHNQQFFSRSFCNSLKNIVFVSPRVWVEKTAHFCISRLLFSPEACRKRVRTDSVLKIQLGNIVYFSLFKKVSNNFTYMNIFDSRQSPVWHEWMYFSVVKSNILEKRWMQKMYGKNFGSFLLNPPKPASPPPPPHTHTHPVISLPPTDLNLLSPPPPHKQHNGYAK